MENATDAPRTKGRIKTVGWIVSFIGMGLWLYGYFTEGGTPVIDWPLYVPEWVAEFVPNWEAELGLALSLIAMVPIYYIEYLDWKAGGPSTDGETSAMAGQKTTEKKPDNQDL